MRSSFINRNFIRPVSSGIKPGDISVRDRKFEHDLLTGIIENPKWDFSPVTREMFVEVQRDVSLKGAKRKAMRFLSAGVKLTRADVHASVSPKQLSPDKATSTLQLATHTMYVKLSLLFS